LIEEFLTSPPTQYRLYWETVLEVKRPNQQYQSTEGKDATKVKKTQKKQITQNSKTINTHKNTENPLDY